MFLWNKKAIKTLLSALTSFEEEQLGKNIFIGVVQWVLFLRFFRESCFIHQFVADWLPQWSWKRSISVNSDWCEFSTFDELYYYISLCSVSSVGKVLLIQSQTLSLGVCVLPTYSCTSMKPIQLHLHESYSCVSGLVINTVKSTDDLAIRTKLY